MAPALPFLVTALLVLPHASRSQDTPCQEWETTLSLGEASQTGFTPYDVLEVGEGSWELTGTDASGVSHTATLTLTYTDGGASEIYQECLYGVQVDVSATLVGDDGWLDESGTAELLANGDPTELLVLTWELGDVLGGTAVAEQADGAWDEDGYLLWLNIEGDQVGGGLSWAGGRSARGCEPEDAAGEAVWTGISG